MALIRSQDTGVARRFFRSLRVGRAPDNDLVLPETTVSGFHACIQWRDGAFFLKDLGSSNGTTLDGEPVSGWTRLDAGAVVGFGPDSRWSVEHLEQPKATATAVHLVRSVEGGAAHPVREDRLTFGSGADCDVSTSSGRPGLHAVLFQEDDQLLVTPVGATEVTVGGAPVDASEPAVLQPGTTFVVAGRSYELVLNPAATAAIAATAQSGVTRRAYLGVQLRLIDRGDFGDIVVTDARGGHRFEDQELRFSLLQVLARDLLDTPSDEPGWMDDERLRLGIWGRRALETQATSTLAKLIHDTRAMLARRGVDGLFIEKKRGRTRLRLDSGSVALE